MGIKIRKSGSATFSSAAVEISDLNDTIAIGDGTGDSCMDTTNNALRVNLVAGGGSGGTALADSSLFTAASTSFTPMGGMLDDVSSDALTEGEAGVVRMTSARALHVHLASQNVALPVTDNGSTLSVDDGGGSLTVDGTVGISGSVTVADGGGSITVDGTVSANQSGTWTVGLSSGTNNIGDVDVATLPGTVETDIAAVKTATQLIDDGIATVASAIPTKGMAAVGTDGTNARILKTDSSGELQVDVLTMPTVTVQDGGGNISIDDGGNSITVDGSVNAAQSGTWTVGLSAGTNNIGDVDVLSLPATSLAAGNLVHVDYDSGAGTQNVPVVGLGLPASGGAVAGGTSTNPIRIDPTGSTTQPVSGSVTANLGSLNGAATAANQTTGNTALSAIQTAVETLDNAISGTEMQVDVVAPLPAGTNNIGDVDVLTLPALPTGSNVIGKVSLVDSVGDSAMDDANNALRVNIVAGAGSGGTAMTDDSAFTVASSSITPAGGIYRATLDSVDDGDVGAFAMTATRSMHVTLRDSVGDSAMDDANNAVRVNIVAGAGSGGTALSDSATFTPASTSFTPIGGYMDDVTHDTLAEGEGGAVRMTSDRGMHVHVASQAGNIGIHDGGGSLTVDGTVAATQSGTWNINNVSGTVSLPTGASTAANQSTANTHLSAIQTAVEVLDNAIAGNEMQVDVITMPVVQVGDNGSTLSIDDGAGSITVDGTVSISGSVAVTDGAGSLTVDGTVAATQSGTWNITNISGTVSLPTGAATSANQSSMVTALQIMDDWDATAGSAHPADGVMTMGSDGTNARRIKTDANGELQVDVLTMPVVQVGDNGSTISIDDGAGSITVDGSVSITGTVAVTDNSGSLTVDGTITASNASGDVAHDGVDSGNPIKIGGKARNANPTAVANNDRVDAFFDLTGKQVVVAQAPRELVTDGSATLTATTNTSVIAAGGAGVNHDVVMITLANTNTTTAVRVDIKDGTTTKLSINLAANGGAVIPFPVPLKGTANTAWQAALSATHTDVRIFMQAVKTV